MPIRLPNLHPAHGQMAAALLRLTAVAVVSTLLCGAPALASGRQKLLTLQEVLEKSNLIVIAEPGKPAMRVEEVPVSDGRTQYPPYRRSLQRWTVRKVLRGQGPAVGATIEVRGAQDGMWLGVYRRRVIEQVNKIVLIDTYQGRSSAEGELKRILLLRSDGKNIEFVAEGSNEALSARAEVLKLPGPVVAEPAAPTPTQGPK